MGAMKRRRKKQVGRGVLPLRKKTILSFLALVFSLASFLTLISFSQRGSLLVAYNLWLRRQLGIGSIFLPFLFLVGAAVFSGLGLPLARFNVVVGSILFFLGFLGLFQSGEIGQKIWTANQAMLTSLGAFFLLLTAILSGFLVLFDLSLAQVAEGFKKIALRVKGRFSPQPQPSLVAKRTEPEIKREEQDQGVEEKKEERFLSSQLPLATPSKLAKVWQHPPLSILKDVPSSGPDPGDIKENAGIIEKTLESFGITARVVEINPGPTVTQYALQVALGTKLSKITSLANDLALALAAPTGQIRIEAPIPGRSLVGIEVPNRKQELVTLKRMLTSSAMERVKSKLAVPLGLDVAGKPVVDDLGRMPHVLIAGQTGSGKSVLLNAWISTFLFRTTPQEVKLLLVDPKRVELTQYNGIPHLLTPVIHEPQKVVSALNWTIAEMNRRYKLFAEVGARNLESYNELAGFQSLPYIVIFIDELADIMLFAPAEVEDAICRIAQMARATGIHLVLATQRPSVDILTGLIKANIPCRISFAVASMVDSRVILDTAGAEKLLGRGDMLFIPPDQAKPTRIQGPYISDEEIKRLIEFLKAQGEAEYQEEVLKQPVTTGSSRTMIVGAQERDALFEQAAELVVRTQKASASFLQRRLKVGYARAARILDQLEEAGIVGPGEGAKPREVLVKSLPDFTRHEQSQPDT